MPTSQLLLRHVVLFKFKEGTTPDQIAEVEDAFRALPAKINAIHGFEWGTDVSVEGIARGFTHCFFLTFKSEEDRAVYLPTPITKRLGPCCDLTWIRCSCLIIGPSSRFTIFD